MCVVNQVQKTMNKIQIMTVTTLSKPQQPFSFFRFSCWCLFALVMNLFMQQAFALQEKTRQDLRSLTEQLRSQGSSDEQVSSFADRGNRSQGTTFGQTNPGNGTGNPQNEADELQQFSKQLPLDSDYYYAIGGPAPIASSGGKPWESKAMSSQPVFSPALSCSVFNQEKALEEAITKRVTKIFEVSHNVAKQLKNSELYNLQATDPRLFNLVTLATEIAKGIVDQNLAACEAIEQSATYTAGGSQGSSQSAAVHALLNQSKAKTIQETYKEGKSSESLLEVIEKADNHDLKPDLVKLGCPCESVCQNIQNDELMIVASSVECAYEQLTEGMPANNIFEREFGNGLQAGAFVAELVGDAGLKPDDEHGAILSNYPAKGLDYMYDQKAQNNFQLLKQAVEITREKLAGGENITDEIIYTSATDDVAHFITGDVLTRLARDPDYEVQGQLANIAFYRAFVQAFRRARFSMRLIDTALRFPNINPVVHQVLTKAKYDLDESTKMLNAEAEATRFASTNLRWYMQKSEADDLRGSGYTPVDPVANTCWENGAPVACRTGDEAPQTEPVPTRDRPFPDLQP